MLCAHSVCSERSTSRTGGINTVSATARPTVEGRQALCKRACLADGTLQAPYDAAYLQMHQSSQCAALCKPDAEVHKLMSDVDLCKVLKRAGYAGLARLHCTAKGWRGRGSNCCAGLRTAGDERERNRASTPERLAMCRARRARGVGTSNIWCVTCGRLECTMRVFQ